MQVFVSYNTRETKAKCYLGNKLFSVLPCLCFSCLVSVPQIAYTIPVVEGIKGKKIPKPWKKWTKPHLNQWTPHKRSRGFSENILLKSL